MPIERTMRIFDTFEDADQADLEYWKTQSYERRLAAMFRLRWERVPENERRIPRTLEMIEIP